MVLCRLIVRNLQMEVIGMGDMVYFELPADDLTKSEKILQKTICLGIRESSQMGLLDDQDGRQGCAFTVV